MVNENEEIDWRYGDLPFADHQGPWKSSADDPDVSEADYEQCYEGLSDYLDEILGSDHYEKGEAPCYFRGDYWGDRSQLLEFLDFQAIKPKLIRALQGKLREPQYKLWRIVVWAEVEADFLIIYPQVICAESVLHDEEVDAKVLEISRRRVEREKRYQQERLEGIEVVRPLLPDAFRSAVESDRIAHLVATAKGSGKDDGIVRMWILHPKDSHVFDLDEYDLDPPNAAYAEDFYVLPDGSLVETIEERPANAMVLALWEFEADEDKCFIMEKDFQTVEFIYS